MSALPSPTRLARPGLSRLVTRPTGAAPVTPPNLARSGPPLFVLLASLLLTLLLVSLLPRAGMAHEAWLLTPEHMAELDARPRPELFTRVTATNAAMLGAAAVAVVAWLLLAATGVADRFPGLAARLEACEPTLP